MFSEQPNITKKTMEHHLLLKLLEEMTVNIGILKNKGILLEADYHIPKIISFVDIEDKNQLYGQWNSEIFFILKNDKIKIRF